MTKLDETLVDALKRRLSEAYHPSAMFLFGSVVWGAPSMDSDIDVLIVVPESDEKFYKRPVVGHRALWGFPRAVDILVYTAAEFRRKAAEIPGLCNRVLNEGKVIYGGI